jgi:preprotein translocase subunit SecA
MGFLSKLFGGNKSEKDVKLITPVVAKINEYFASYQSLSNDALRAKTTEFKERIKKHLEPIDATIAKQKEDAEALPASEMQQRDVAYREIDKLVKDRDKEIEVVLKEILPEAFAVVKESARTRQKPKC